MSIFKTVVSNFIGKSNIRCTSVLSGFNKRKNDACKPSYYYQGLTKSFALIKQIERNYVTRSVLYGKYNRLTLQIFHNTVKQLEPFQKCMQNKLLEPKVPSTNGKQRVPIKGIEKFDETFVLILAMCVLSRREAVVFTRLRRGHIQVHTVTISTGRDERCRLSTFS